MPKHCVQLPVSRPTGPGRRMDQAAAGGVQPPQQLQGLCPGCRGLPTGPDRASVADGDRKQLLRRHGSAAAGRQAATAAAAVAIRRKLYQEEAGA